MKRKILYLRYGPAVFLFLLTAGCATYEKPPLAVSQSSYTQLQDKEKNLLPPGLSHLTLEKAQQIAVDNNPGFKSKQFAVNSARARYYQSFSGYSPTLNAGVSIGQAFTRMYSASGMDKYNSRQDNFATALYGQFLIFDGLSREMNMLASKYQLRETESLRDDAERLLRRAVGYSYNDVLLADARRRIALADMEYSEILLKDSRRKLEAGTAPYTDVLNFHIRYNTAKLALNEAEYALKANKYILAGYFGLTDGTLPDTVRFPEISKPSEEILPSVSVYLDTALANRPDLKAIRAQYEKLKFIWWSSLGAFAPRITADYAFGLDQTRTVYSGGVSGTEKKGEFQFGYALAAEWNLLKGGADYFNAKAAYMNFAEADWLLAEVWNNVITEVRAAYDNCMTYVEQASLSEQILKLSRENRDKVENEYRVGTAEVTRMNEAQRDLVNAENDLAFSIINLKNAKIRLLTAVNSLSENRKTDSLKP